MVRKHHRFVMSSYDLIIIANEKTTLKVDITWTWYLESMDRSVVVRRCACFIGPILDDRLKETFLKPWKGVLCIHFRACLRTVCVSLCLCVCLYAGYRAKLSTKEPNFFVFRNFHVYAFYWYFSIFSLI